MKELKFEEFIEFDVIKNINNLISSRLNNGKLTDEIINSMLEDNETFFGYMGLLTLIFRALIYLSFRGMFSIRLHFQQILNFQIKINFQITLIQKM